MALKKLRDLGLTYEEALHGVQTSIAYEQGKKGIIDDEHKHLRTGIDARAVDMLGLVHLLLRKGLFKEAEYLESMRLAMNEEVARLQQTHGMQFR